MGAKSFFAFRFSMETLIEQSGTRLYFWTFTFRERLEVDEACRRWTQFLKSKNGLTSAFPLCSGIRVYEMHPGGKDGFSHGLHIHAIVDQFLPVDIVRTIWHRHAGSDSRLQCEAVGPGRAFYIGKYLTKGGRVAALAGKRLWQCFGLVEKTGCADIIVQNAWTEGYKFLDCCIKGFKRLPWPERLKVAKDFAYGTSFEASLEKYGYVLEEEWIPKNGE